MITIRVPKELHRRARVLSVQRGETLQAVLEELLLKWVNHFEKAA